MKNKLSLLLILTYFIQDANAQVFKSDWKLYSSDKYTVEFKENITTYFTLDNIGELHFISKSDPTKFVVFYVFNAEKINGKFISDDADEQTINSCVRVAKSTLSTLYFKKYYYLVTPWQNCEISKKSIFNDLPEEILNYILK
ncbi:hypothetical protein FLAN108750_02230 [Flavobacterium antarcticum]|uniref:hypothetical protein n=1 Tax=Flavobacterium antarcticum TaxID=271155 RepID=UPI0003B33D13|nr:hypothetical protein [Flavobacterium antarcticum]